MANSGADARRKTTQGGVSVDDERITDPNFLVQPGTYLLKVGKKSIKRILVSSGTQ